MGKKLAYNKPFLRPINSHNKFMFCSTGSSASGNGVWANLCGNGVGVAAGAAQWCYSGATGAGGAGSSVCVTGGGATIDACGDGSTNAVDYPNNSCATGGIFANSACNTGGSP